MSKAQRDKGKRGERIAVHYLRKVFPDAARDLNDVYAKSGVDLTNTGALLVQVKHYKKHAPISKLYEVQFEPNSDKIPVLFSLPTDRKERDTVTLYVDDFIRILEDIGVVYND